jgi:ABC-type antimicrobial peptide transport system permease subunit
MLWPDGDALGKAFMKSDERVTVVGIVANSKYHELAEKPMPFVYVPALQPFATFTGRISFLVQTAGEPTFLVGSVKDAIHDIDPDLAFMRVQTMEDAVERVLGRYRVAANVVSLFGSLALVLAVIGLYGVLSYLVVRRTRTIGIQMALGATQGRVARGVLREGLWLSLLGVALGIPLALASSRFVESFLYDINPKDPVTFSVVALVLMAVACLAAGLPSLRASRVNPVDALREE